MVVNLNAMKREVFDPVANRVFRKRDSLKHVKKFLNAGIEGWLKVEAVAAFEGHVEKLQNKGPDLRLRSGLQVELKGSTDLNLSWIYGGLKYKTPCLFLCDGQPRGVERLKADPRMALVAHRVFSVGKDKWIVGLVVARDAARPPRA